VADGDKPRALPAASHLEIASSFGVRGLQVPRACGSAGSSLTAQVIAVGQRHGRQGAKVVTA